MKLSPSSRLETIGGAGADLERLRRDEVEVADDAREDAAAVDNSAPRGRAAATPRVYGTENGRETSTD